MTTKLVREKRIDSCVPMSGTLSTCSSIDVSLKSNFSNTIIDSSSVKSSFSGKASDGMGAYAKTHECKSIDNFKNKRLVCVESGNSNLSMASYISSVSDNNESCALHKPHKGNDPRWEAIRLWNSEMVFGFKSF